MTTLHRAVTVGAAGHLHAEGVGYYDGGPIPSGTDWPIYLYEWGAAEQQLVVNVPILTPEVLTYGASMQVLVRAETDAIAEAKASAAADALHDLDYPAWGGVSVSHIELTSIARLGRDGNGRALWVSKFRLYGRN